jgi:tRNA nucleotidyltransferase (CCA-adding enzyme)
METYLVGGAVRELLLRELLVGDPILHDLLSVPTTQENDYVVVGAHPENLLAQGFKPIGKDFPVFLHPVTHEEYALARTERKQGAGYKGFSCYAAPDVSLEMDLKRRDLTINAMAKAQTGEIIDPYGGYRDLQRRILRHVSPAFAEDPVRILRIARFMARFTPLGFKIAPETQQLMQAMVQSGEVNALVPERIWKEFTRALVEANPYAFIETLYDCGALAVICPELARLFNYQNTTIYSVNWGEQSLTTLNQAVFLSRDPAVRFAALMLHINQPILTKSDLSIQSLVDFDINRKTRWLIPQQQLAERWRLPLVYRELLMLSTSYYPWCHRFLALSPKEKVLLLEQLDAFRRPQRLHPIWTVCEADWLVYDHKDYPQKKHFFEALTRTRSITATALLKAGLQGVALKQHLRQARIDVLSPMK